MTEPMSLVHVGQNHLIMRLARGNHRQAVLRLVDQTIEHDRIRTVDHLQDRLIELGGVRTANAMHAIGLRQLDEIGQRGG